MSDTFYIRVIRYSDDSVVKEFATSSQRKADRIDDGLNINLNHDEFYTLVVQEKSD